MYSKEIVTRFNFKVPISPIDSFLFGEISEKQIDAEQLGGNVFLLLKSYGFKLISISLPTKVTIESER